MGNELAASTERDKFICRRVCQGVPVVRVIASTQLAQSVSLNSGRRGLGAWPVRSEGNWQHAHDSMACTSRAAQDMTASQAGRTVSARLQWCALDVRWPRRGVVACVVRRASCVVRWGLFPLAGANRTCRVMAIGAYRFRRVSQQYTRLPFCNHLVLPRRSLFCSAR